MLATEPKAIIEQMMGDLEAMDPEAFPPNYPMKVEGEEKVAIVEDLYTRKVYALAKHFLRESEQLQLDIKYESDPQERERLKTMAVELQTKAKMLDQMFWFLVNTQVPGAWLTMNLGIRAGWIIVKYETRDPLREMFGNLFNS